MSVLRLIPGWLMIGWLVYYYVYSQLDLVQYPIFLITVSIVGLFFSFLFSSTEMAIAECGQEELEELQTMAETINSQLECELADGGGYRHKYYLAERKKILRLQEIINNSNQYNPSIVIGNNIANVAIAALLPQALSAHQDRTDLQFTLGEKALFEPLLGMEALPFAGTETLTFFSALLAIIVFGEIIPKRLAIQNPLVFVNKLSLFIRVTKFIFGWLGSSLASLGAPINWRLKIRFSKR